MLIKKQTFVFLTLLISVVLDATGHTQDFPRPTGIYALGPGTLQPLSDRLSGIRDYPFVDGYAWRVSWPDFEIGPEEYDFSPVDSVIARLEPLGQKLTISLFATKAPEDVINNPAVETYFGIGTRSGGSQDELRAVTWDSTALSRWEKFVKALAAHQIPDASLDGQLVALKVHPVLAQISSSIVGLGSVRDKEQRLVNAQGYERDKFIQAVLRSTHAIVDEFSDKFAFVGFFRMNDQISAPALDEVLLDSLSMEFDGATNPRLGLFQENLACSTPAPSFSWALDREQNDRPVLFQMLQSWKNPFSNPDKTDPCLTDSTGPDVGMQYAFDTYNCRYFEVYVADLDFEAFHPALQQMHDFIAELVTSVDRSDEPLPENFVLQQNFPNPFNPSTTIRFSVPGSGRTTFEVYNLLGQRVAVLFDGELPAGEHSVVFNAKNLTSGVYFYQLTAGQFTQIRKAILMK